MNTCWLDMEREERLAGDEVPHGEPDSKSFREVPAWDGRRTRPRVRPVGGGKTLGSIWMSLYFIYNVCILELWEYDLPK